MKVDSKIFRGIEYIQLDELPQLQQDALIETLSEHLFIKILIDGKVVGRCLQYKDYCHWYDTVFIEKVLELKGARVVQTPALEIKSDLALDKA